MEDQNSPPMLLSPYGYTQPTMVLTEFLPQSQLPNQIAGDPTTFPVSVKATRTIPSPPSTFPTPIRSPQDLRPRHANQGEQLHALDVANAGSENDVVRDMKILETHRLTGDIFAGGQMYGLGDGKGSFPDVGIVGFDSAGSTGMMSADGGMGVDPEAMKLNYGIGAQMGMGESKGVRGVKEALHELREHCRERMAYVHNASERLQAATGVRNDLPFDLPNPYIPVLPESFGPLVFPQNAQQIAPSLPTPDTSSASFSLNQDTAEAVSINVPRTDNTALPNKISLDNVNGIEIDEETGKGLREWLMVNGKNHGMQKRECQSISLHDLTPDPNTGAFANVLLGHYGTAGVGERVDVYETNVPITYFDDTQGEMIFTSARWIWFLIQRPVVSISSKNLTTLPTDDDQFSSGSDSSDSYEDYVYCPPRTDFTPPPNFKDPIPLSYAVFACPAKHLTEYDERVENLDAAQDAPPVNTSVRLSLPWVKQKVVKEINVRKDYDLSYQGTARFELTGGSVLFGPNSTQQFLSVEKIGPWYDNDKYELRPENARQNLQNAWEAAISTGALEVVNDCIEEGRQREIRNLLEEPPAPYKGLWWEKFYKAMWEDAERWRAVRRAMGNGKLRVITRWTEVQVEEKTEVQNADMSGLGGELNFAAGAGVAGAKKSPFAVAGGPGSGKERKARGGVSGPRTLGAKNKRPNDILIGRGRYSANGGGPYSRKP